MPVLTAEDQARVATLLAKLDAKNPSRGWGALDQSDIEANAGVFQQVINTARFCEHCPGAARCREDRSSPKNYVPVYLKLGTSKLGAIVSAAWAICEPAKAIRQTVAYGGKKTRKTKQQTLDELTSFDPETLE